jgi:hypothetical protein
MITEAGYIRLTGDIHCSGLLHGLDESKSLAPNLRRQIYLKSAHPRSRKQNAKTHPLPEL